jgi:hypothetical protein
MRSMLRPLKIATAVLHACAWGGVIMASACCHPQQTESPQSSEQKPVFTLKVYADLVQVPTLVLNHDRQPIRTVNFQRFQVSLDHGKRFAPTHVRMEGADPLNLAILIDEGGKQPSDFVGDFAAAAAGMAAELQPQDRISIYVLSCNLLRTAREIQPSPELLSGLVEKGLQSPKLGKDDAGASCGTKVYLWGAMAAVVKDMSGAAGRRAMLVISNGNDDGSVISWPKLHEYAGSEGVALFGLTEATGVWGRSLGGIAFRIMCESTGGILMQGERRDLQKRLQQWIEMLRDRYVVEFPRPPALVSGQHDINISVKNDGEVFTTVAGVSVSLPDPKITDDPNYVPSDEGMDIPVGKQRPSPH